MDTYSIWRLIILGHYSYYNEPYCTMIVLLMIVKNKVEKREYVAEQMCAQTNLLDKCRKKLLNKVYFVKSIVCLWSCCIHFYNSVMMHMFYTFDAIAWLVAFLVVKINQSVLIILFTSVRSFKIFQYNYVWKQHLWHSCSGSASLQHRLYTGNKKILYQGDS